MDEQPWKTDEEGHNYFTEAYSFVLYGAPHVVLQNASGHSLHQASLAGDWPSFHVFASLFLKAAMFEGAVNFLGTHALPSDWADLQDAKIVARVVVLSMKVGFPLDKSRSYFKSLRELIKVRNEVAHPKSKAVPLTPTRTGPTSSSLNTGDAIAKALPALPDSFRDHATTIKAFQSLDQLLRDLGQACGLDPFPSTASRLAITPKHPLS